MLAVSMVLIFLALVLYSTAIWSERMNHHLTTWMVITFLLAFVCDLAGTSMMFLQATAKFEPSLHSLCGYVALIIMGLHFVWGIIALKINGRAEMYFHRYSVFAWALWLAAFTSGIPKA